MIFFQQKLSTLCKFDILNGNCEKRLEMDAWADGLNLKTVHYMKQC